MKSLPETEVGYEICLLQKNEKNISYQPGIMTFNTISSRLVVLGKRAEMAQSHLVPAPA